MFYGQHVKTGNYAERITHYSVLRALADDYGLPDVGSSSTAARITGTWL